MPDPARLHKLLTDAQLLQRERASGTTLVWYGNSKLYRLNDDGDEVAAWDVSAFDAAGIYDLTRFNRLPPKQDPERT